MSDGGEDARRVQTHMHPGREHWTDWFHTTMRITALQQKTKSLHGEANPVVKEAAGLSTRIDSLKPLLWHGKVVEALDRMGDMLLHMELIRASSSAAEKLAAGLAEFEIYTRNNRESFRTSGSATGKESGSARHSGSRRSTNW